MESPVPHYLRFARTLALVTTIALPACADGTVAADDEGAPTGATTAEPQTAPAPAPAPAPVATATTTETAPPTTATTTTTTATATAENDAGAEGDASYAGFSSGPLPPPEMPASRV